MPSNPRTSDRSQRGGEAANAAALALGLGVAVSMLGGADLVSAADVKDKVTVQIESIGVQPGMPPGMYVCARGHLHVKALVQNQAGVGVATSSSSPSRGP